MVDCRQFRTVLKMTMVYGLMVHRTVPI